jgi:hypothetical protein
MVLLQLTQLVGGVGVEEGRLVVEQHLDAAVLRGPAVDLALAAAVKRTRLSISAAFIRQNTGCT